MSAYLCYCICPDQDSANHIAQTLVRERLAACVSALPGMTSVYRWQGALEQAQELLLLIKTGAERLPAPSPRIPELHRRELPELIAVEVASGLPAYLQWISVQIDEEN